MSEAYAREILRRNVAQICQTIGWNGINSTPLDILVHVLEKYICALGTQASKHAEQFNRTEPNLDDLGLVFRNLHVQLPELAEYTRCVPPVPPPVRTERFPKPKESNLNFLKPGSHEVVTRPMHVHEHLPPMYPERERDTPAVAGTVEICQNGIDSGENTSCASPEISVTDSPEKPKDIFKRPTDPVSFPSSKRPRLRLDEEERTREISSVMMTMSGFLSPAREGKLPEARPPTIISERHDRHKVNSHHPNTTKVPLAEKSDKKSKKNKLLNGKIVKSKRKDKSHKGESNKSRDSSKLDRYPPGYTAQRSKDVHPAHHNHVTMPAPKMLPPPSKPSPISQPVPSSPTFSDSMRPVIKQEPVDFPLPPSVSRNFTPAEDAIPVPRKIPISKSPLVSNPLSVNKHPGSSFVLDREIKREVVDEEEKLASQPDRSKINIFKRISNKLKEDKNTSEVVTERLHSNPMVSRLQNSTDDIRFKPDENIVNNNNSSPVDLSKEFDIRAHEVISIDDDSLDNNVPMPQTRMLPLEPKPGISINKSIQPAPSKGLAAVPKVKKEKKHKDKKDKAAKLEAKLKKQQQQLGFEMAHTVDKKNIKQQNDKPSKPGRQKKEPKMPHLPPGFPFFPTMAPGRGMMPGPGLIPNAGLLTGNEFLTGLANNPALRGLHSQNLIGNPFALGGGPGLIPGSSFLPGLPNHLIPNMGNFPHTSRSSSSKIPPMLRRPSLEVIAVNNDEDRMMHKSSGIGNEKDRHEKHKSSTIPNILQKQKPKSNKEHKSNLYKMPPVQPDITIELNPPKSEPVRQEPPREPSAPPPVRLPTSEASEIIKNSDSPDIDPIPMKTETADVTPKEGECSEKKKDKSHKKEKRDKDGIKIKKKKDKKDKNKDKSEKKKEKEERQEIKDRIKKEKKEKKKEKSAINDGLVPKLTLKLGSSNSNSPMPPSSPDTFKLNIKPIKKEADSPPAKDEPVSREQSRSPELAQISALVTRPPKQKNSKYNHVGEPEAQASSSPPSSPQRKNRPPSSHSKYKRILFKPLSKKGHVENFDDESGSVVEESPKPAADKPSGPLPTPFYLDEHGNKVWVCPACGSPDNGSPMIGCDGCDGWYHWICVGITEDPGATEDWFCKSCLAKRTAMLLAGVTSGKKRGRKPKGEKVRDCH